MILKLVKSTELKQKPIILVVKGINVSLVLQNLGVTSKALGFTAGFSGQELKRLLDKAGCSYDFVDIATGCTRVNVKVAENPETAINAQGPIIGKEEFTKPLAKLEQLQQDDILVLAGSIRKHCLTIFMNRFYSF